MNSIKTANQLKRAGKLKQAINEYSQIIKSNPRFYNAYYELGMALAKQGNLKDGINQLKLALEINPNSALCHYSLGDILFQQGELREAIKYYRQAIKINPSFYKFYYSLANALAQVGDIQAASDAYQQAVKLNPNLGSINGVITLASQAIEKYPEVRYLQLIFGDLATVKKELDIEQANDWVELYTQVNRSQIIRLISAKTKEKKLPCSDSLVAHYQSDGEKVVTGSGQETRVCLIQDESGNGNHLIQSQVQKMPIWKVDRLNNQETIAFSSACKTLLKSCSNLKIAKPRISWFAVFTPGIEYANSKKLPHGAVFRAEVNSFPGFYGTFIGNKKGFYELGANCRSGEKTFHSINNSKFSPGQIYLVTAIWDGVGDKFMLRINGCAEGEINDVVPTGIFNHGKIGIGADTNNKHGFNGEFYELILYESVLELDDVVEVEKYLCQRWRIEHPGFKIDELSSKILKNTRFSWSYYYLGEYFAKLGYLSKAIENYDLALTLNPTSAFMRYKYGDLMRQNFSQEEAIDWLLAAVNKTAKPPLVCYVQLANVLEKTGRLNQAIACYEEILEQKPGRLDYVRKKDALKAQKLLDDFLAIESDLLTYAKQNYLTDESHNLEKTIEKNIEGRCCHHRVIALKFIRDFFKDKLNNYLEIGVHNGTSMSYVLQSPSRITAVGVDLFEDTYGYYKESDRINLEQTQNNITNNNPYKHQFTLIKGNAWDKKTLERVKNVFQGEQVELLFIDGDHSYEGVKKDFTIYSHLVTSGGLIVIDDYEPRYPGILKFVSEIDWKRYVVLGVFQENELILQKRGKP